MSNLPSNVQVSEDECLDQSENVMMATGIVLPDKRELYELNGKLWCLIEGGDFEKYDPCMILPWNEKLSRIRKIVEDKQYAMIEGVLVDGWTAQYIIGLYDHLSLKYQLSYLSKPIPKMAELAFRLLK